MEIGGSGGGPWPIDGFQAADVELANTRFFVEMFEGGTFEFWNLFGASKVGATGGGGGGLDCMQAVTSGADGSRLKLLKIKGVYFSANNIFNYNLAFLAF